MSLLLFLFLETFFKSYLRVGRGTGVEATPATTRQKEIICDTLFFVRTTTAQKRGLSRTTANLVTTLHLHHTKFPIILP